MTKAELIDRIARNRELPPEVTKKAVAKILDLAFAELGAYFVRSRLTRASTPRFSYPKFGTFTKKKRSGRRGVNPRTLEPMDIEACETVDFKPSTELRRLLNEASVPAKTTKATGRKKKAARSSTKTSSKRKAKAKPKTKAKARIPAAAVAGPGGRKLVTRDDVALEPATPTSVLPAAPLQKVDAAASVKSPRRKRKLDPAGS